MTLFILKFYYKADFEEVENLTMLDIGPAPQPFTAIVNCRSHNGAIRRLRRAKKLEKKQIVSCHKLEIEPNSIYILDEC